MTFLCSRGASDSKELWVFKPFESMVSKENGFLKVSVRALQQLFWPFVYISSKLEELARLRDKRSLSRL